MKHFISCLFALIATSIMSYAQQWEVSVYVQDLNGPIVGAVVQVVGTSEGAVTGRNGWCLIRCLEDQTIRVSSPGYVTQAVIVKTQMIVVTLDEDITDQGYDMFSPFFAFSLDNQLYKKEGEELLTA